MSGDKGGDGLYERVGRLRQEIRADGARAPRGFGHIGEVFSKLGKLSQMIGRFLFSIALLIAGTVEAGTAAVSDPPVKKSHAGVCHDVNSPSYFSTRHFVVQFDRGMPAVGWKVAEESASCTRDR